jgi:hypothetical protein
MSLPFDLPTDVTGLITELRGPTFVEKLQKIQSDALEARKARKVGMDVDKIVQKMVDKTANALMAFAKNNMMDRQCKAEIQVPAACLKAIADEWITVKSMAIARLVRLYMERLQTVCDGVTIKRLDHFYATDCETMKLPELVTGYAPYTDVCILSLSFSF